MNIYDIAKAANTSIATVSRVLNDKGGVGPQTRQKILKIVEESGYVPNSFAQGLNMDSIKMVGVLCYDIMDMYCAQCVSLLDRLLQENGYNTFLCCTGNDAKNKNEYFDLLISKRVDAVFLVSSKFGDEANSDHIARAAAETPIFLLNSMLDLDGVYCILSDECSGMEDAVAYLVKHGHRRIAYLHDDLVYSGKRKLKGYLDGIEKSGLENDEALVLKNTFGTDYAINDGILMTKKLLDDGVPFTAVLSYGDPYAAGAIKALQERGISVPEDVEVIGFDNSPFCGYTSPCLSSVESRLSTITDVAVRYFINNLKGQTIPRKTVLTTELVLRESTRED